MNENEQQLFDAMVGCKLPEITAAVDNALEAKMAPEAIINVMSEGMSQVGVLFERGKLFLPHVLSSANGMKKAMEKLEPLLEKSSDETSSISIVMGTVEGDVHDIGKSICSTMLQCAGYEIHDMGRDVPTQTFLDEVKGGCTMCGMSALMTTTMVVMKTIVDKLKEEGLRDGCTVLVGGAPITQSYADKIGADVYGESASETVRKVRGL